MRWSRLRFPGLRSALRGNLLFLGWTSFLTDVSSEMVYPLLPAFFTGLVPPAAAAVYIGFMDGVAESTSSILKMYVGKLSDRLGRRKGLAVAGYLLSSVARPFIAAAAAGWHVVALRFVDRIGKGVRTAPRDALVSDSVPCEVRGVAFSFHRMMDHAGALCGPLVAGLFLWGLLGHAFLWQHAGAEAGPAEMRALRYLFALSLVPGLAAVVVLWQRVRETSPRAVPCGPGRAGDASAKPPLTRGFWIFLAAVTLFTLGNSSDLFLLFYAQTRFGLGLGWLIALWMLLHLSKILVSLPGGRFSDLAGRRPAIAVGWTIYLAVYAAMPFASTLWMVAALLVVYGAHYGMVEGAERALVADFVPAPARGRAYGFYHGTVGLAALPASVLFGLFWAALGPRVAFLIGASLAAAALVVLLAFVPRSAAERE